MASHFQTEAWVNFRMANRFVYQLWFGKKAHVSPFPQGNKSGPEGAVEIESRNLKKHSILDFGILHCTWKFER